MVPTIWGTCAKRSGNITGNYSPLTTMGYLRATRSLKYYFVDVSWTGFEKLEVNPARHEELIDTLRTYSFYVDKEDVLTTPGRTFNEVEYDMAPEVKTAYTKMKNELYVELKEEKYITAPSAAAS